MLKDFFDSPLSPPTSVGQVICPTYPISVTRLGDFLKFSVTIFYAKEAHIFCDFLGNLQKHHFLSKNCHGYFLGNFWNILATFNSYN